jgi:hypothetical protein
MLLTPKAITCAAAIVASLCVKLTLPDMTLLFD